MKEQAAIRKRSVTLAGHRTSISLEDIFWRHLRQAAAEEGLSLAALVSRIDLKRLEGQADTGAADSEDSGLKQPAMGLSSALRVYVVQRLTDQLSKHEDSGREAGHY